MSVTTLAYFILAVGASTVAASFAHLVRTSQGGFERDEG
jgi:hypothetical protein